jgi:hypothetical protein
MGNILVLNIIIFRVALHEALTVFGDTRGMAEV